MGSLRKTEQGGDKGSRAGVQDLGPAQELKQSSRGHILPGLCHRAPSHVVEPASCVTATRQIVRRVATLRNPVHSRHQGMGHGRQRHHHHQHLLLPHIWRAAIKP